MSVFDLMVMRLLEIRTIPIRPLTSWQIKNGDFLLQVQSIEMGSSTTLLSEKHCFKNAELDRIILTQFHIHL